MAAAASPTKFVFRADASVSIGTGHVVRCLTLAQCLSEQGAECHFICRDVKGHLREKLEASGFAVHMLPEEQPTGTAPLDDGSIRNEVKWEADAARSHAIIRDIMPNWLVLDHYGLDQRWQERALPTGVALLVIDDLANRPHRADLLMTPISAASPATTKTSCRTPAKF